MMTRLNIFVGSEIGDSERGDPSRGTKTWWDPMSSVREISKIALGRTGQPVIYAYSDLKRLGSFSPSAGRDEYFLLFCKDTEISSAMDALMNNQYYGPAWREHIDGHRVVLVVLLSKNPWMGVADGLYDTYVLLWRQIYFTEDTAIIARIVHDYFRRHTRAFPIKSLWDVKTKFARTTTLAEDMSVGEKLNSLEYVIARDRSSFLKAILLQGYPIKFDKYKGRKPRGGRGKMLRRSPKDKGLIEGHRLILRNDLRAILCIDKITDACTHLLVSLVALKELVHGQERRTSSFESTTRRLRKKVLLFVEYISRVYDLARNYYSYTGRFNGGGRGSKRVGEGEGGTEKEEEEEEGEVKREEIGGEEIGGEESEAHARITPREGRDEREMERIVHRKLVLSNLHAARELVMVKSLREATKSAVSSSASRLYGDIPEKADLFADLESQKWILGDSVLMAATLSMRAYNNLVEYTNGCYFLRKMFDWERVDEGIPSAFSKIASGSGDKRKLT